MLAAASDPGVITVFPFRIVWMYLRAFSSPTPGSFPSNMEVVCWRLDSEASDRMPSRLTSEASRTSRIAVWADTDQSDRFQALEGRQSSRIRMANTRSLSLTVGIV